MIKKLKIFENIYFVHLTFKKNIDFFMGEIKSAYSDFFKVKYNIYNSIFLYIFTGQQFLALIVAWFTMYFILTKTRV